LCPKDKSGKCISNDTSGLTNTSLDLKYIDVDDNPDTFDSSQAQLDIPDNAQIIYAALYAQGYVDNDTRIRSVKRKVSKPILLTVENLNETYSVDPQIIDVLPNYHYNDGTLDGYTYALFAEVNDLIGKTGKEVNGWITAANVYANEGTEDTGLGNFGAWTLVVVYQDSNEKFKNISIFDGYKEVSRYKPEVKIDISGFVTPFNGPIESSLSVFAGEGDKYIPGDKLEFDGTDISHKDNNQDNAFYSAITTDNSRNPNLENNNGIDILTYNIGSSGLGLLTNGQTSAELILTSTQDKYFPNMVVFSTDVYVPNVCYENLRFFDSQGNELDKNAQVTVGDTITVQFNVKNMDYETARNVYVKNKFDNNITEYVENSTYVKNVKEDEFVHINDNESVGNLEVNYSNENKKWVVGILGDSNKEFKSTILNDDYVASIKFKSTVVAEGNVTFDFMTDYVYSIGDDDYSYDDVLPPCEEEDNYLTSYMPISAEFNVVNENFSGNTDPLDPKHPINLLYTQIVKKPFSARLVHMKSDRVTLEKFSGLIRISVIDESNATTQDELDNRPDELVTPKFVKMKNKSKVLNNLSVKKAIRDARFRITYIADGRGNVYRWTNTHNCSNQFGGSGNIQLNCIWEMMQAQAQNNSQACSNGTCPCETECKYNDQSSSNAQQYAKNNPECLICLFNHFGKTVYSRDNFAIRPSRFEIVQPSGVPKLIAGKKYTIQFKALDETNQSAQGYSNVVIHLPSTQNPVSVMLEYNESKVNQGCQTGVVQFLSDANFTDGIANVDMNYSEVGDLNLTLKEIPGSEFALIDANDSINPNGRFIPQLNTVLSYKPAHFKISSISYNNGGNGYTYISSDLNMSSKLNYQIIAENDNNHTTQNYSAVCYAKNVDVNVTHAAVAIPNKLVFKEQNSTGFTNTANTNDINITVPYNRFSSGVANSTILINFEKDYKTPVNPFNFTLNDINATDSDGVKGDANVLQSVQFIYGRINIPNVAGYSTVLHNSVKYEYFNNNEWITNTAHSTLAEGNISVAKSIIPGAAMTLNPITGGVQDIKYQATKQPPYKTKGEYSVSSWLWYHPKALNYQDPSATNHNCLTHPCNKIAFLIIANQWAGVGDDSSKYAPDNNNTAKIKSKADVNNSKAQVKHLNW